ncbi:MAG: methyl-accepting chemotaxis protein [Thermodesulfobacteriota bacterium]
MQWFNDMKIGRRLLVSFGAVLALLVVVVGIGLWGVSSVTNATEVILAQEGKLLQHAAQLDANILGLRRYEKDIFLNVEKPEKVADYFKKWTKEYALVNERIAVLEEVAVHADDVAKIAAIKETLREYKAGFDMVYGMVGAGEIKTPQEGNAAIGKYKEPIHTMEATSVQLADDANAAVEQAGTAIRRTAQRVIWLVAAFSLLAVILGVVLALVVARGISLPLRQGVDFSIAVAGGDLTRSIALNRKDEIGELTTALNAMARNLSAMIGEIEASVNTVSSSATEMSSIAEHLYAGANVTVQKANTVSAAAEEMSSNMTSVASAMEQASSNVNTVASATEEMSASIGEISRSAESAKVAAGNAVRQSDLASERVNELGQAAEEIGVVTETIRAISDKTDLLAMNATIEAARAGEAGKGFAVVASEIKELAKKTAESTEDIARRLQAIQKSTSLTAAEIREVGEAISQVDGIVGVIATAVTQQKTATAEISENIGQTSLGIREVTVNVSQTSQAAGQVAQEIGEVNESAGGIENSSAQVQQSAAELSKLAEQLKEMIRKFKV